MFGIPLYHIQRIIILLSLFMSVVYQHGPFGEGVYLYIFTLFESRIVYSQDELLLSNNWAHFADCRKKRLAYLVLMEKADRPQNRESQGTSHH